MYKKLIYEIKRAIIDGLAPKKIALTVGIGMVFGTIPFCISTILCTLFAIILKLNQPIMQLINFILFPLQIILFIPYLKLGEFLFGEKTIPLSYFEIEEIFKLSFKLFILKLGKAIIFALIGWAIFSPILFFFSYKISLIFLKKFKFLEGRR